MSNRINSPLSAAQIVKAVSSVARNKSESGKAIRAKATKAYFAKRRTETNKRMPVGRLYLNDYAKLDCGCIIRFVKNSDKHEQAVFRPLTVLNNSKCKELWLAHEVGIAYGDHELGIYGSWRHGTVGAKKHYVGSVIYDGGARSCVRLSRKEALEHWGEED